MRPPFTRRRRQRPKVEIERVDDHRQPAELHVDVRAFRELLDRRAPDREHLAAPVRPDPERPAEMVEHDPRLRAAARHRGQRLDLRVVDPRLEGEVVRRQPLHAAAERRLLHQPRRRYIGRAADDRRVVGRDLADAAEPPAGRRDLSFQHRVEIVEAQIGKADDAGADPRLAAAPVALLGDRADEFALADAAHFLRPARAIARAALDEHGRDDIVARIAVRQQFVEQIAAARVIPQMMVRIDDRQIGLEDFLPQLAEPFGVGQRARVFLRFSRHGVLLRYEKSHRPPALCIFDAPRAAPRVRHAP
jgi:hypothetical protein